AVEACRPRECRNRRLTSSASTCRSTSRRGRAGCGFSNGKARTPSERNRGFYDQAAATALPAPSWDREPGFFPACPVASGKTLINTRVVPGGAKPGQSNGGGRSVRVIAPRNGTDIHFEERQHFRFSRYSTPPETCYLPRVFFPCGVIHMKKTILGVMLAAGALLAAPAQALDS